MSDRPKKKPKVKQVFLANKLREKVGGMPGKTGSIDPELLKKAEAKVAEIASTYNETARDDIADLQSAFQSCVDAGPDQGSYLRIINHMVHNIRGQGGSFGYPLLTEFAAFLFDFTDGLSQANTQQLAIIKAHIDTMYIVVQQKIIGDGGAVGRDLKESLKKAIAKHSAKK
jgi:hypothetical protein